MCVCVLNPDLSKADWETEFLRNVRYSVRNGISEEHLLHVGGGENDP